MLLDRVAIVGVGLLGGSLGLALQKRGLARTVIGHVRRPERVAICEQLGVVHRATPDLAEAVRDADLVILGTPVGRMETLAPELAPLLKRGAVVTDVGSVKQNVVAALEPAIAAAGAHFIGSHPMAGSEKSGPEAARENLFDGAQCIVTPTANSDASSLQCVESLWRSVGGAPLCMSPALHDELLARTSHLPHLLAAALVQLVLDPAAPPEQARVCASGFRDTTRIASGSPGMWRDIATANGPQIVAALDDLVARLQSIRQSLASGDADALAMFFERSKTARDRWVGGGRSPE